MENDKKCSSVCTKRSIAFTAPFPGVAGAHLEVQLGESHFPVKVNS